MADYSNLILIYEEIINELSDELVNKVRQKRKENAEKAWQEMCRQHGEGKSINQMLLAAAKDRANELLCKQRNERKKGIEHDPEDTEDLQVQYKEIKRNNDILKEDRERDVRKDLLNEMNTGISGMMDTQPNPVVGGPVNITKQKKGKQKRGQLGYKYLKIRTASMK